MSRAIEKDYDSGSRRDKLPPTGRSTSASSAGPSTSVPPSSWWPPSSALLVPVTPRELQSVGEVLVVVYLVLALASWLDFRSRS